MSHRGYHRLTRARIVPNRWQGQTGCLVGPFSCREIASYFVQFVVVPSHIAVEPGCVFAHGDSWFVEIPDADSGPATRHRNASAHDRL